MLAIMVAGGCGGSDDDPAEGADVADLTAALPADGLQFAASDLVSLREELGLPADADPATFPGRGEEASEDEFDLFTATAQSLPHVRAAATALLDPQEDPVVASIDHGQVSAAARATGDFGELVLMTTAQPFDEIAAALEDEGFSQDGDVWVPRKGAEPVTGGAPWQVADGGDGRVVLAPERAAIDAALGDEPEGSPAKDLLGAVSGSVRFATDLQGGDSCLEVIAGGENPGTHEGEIVIEPTEAPDPARAGEAQETEGVSVEEAEIDGDLVRFPFTADAKAPGLGLDRLARSLAVADFYDCS